MNVSLIIVLVTSKQLPASPAITAEASRAAQARKKFRACTLGDVHETGSLAACATWYEAYLRSRWERCDAVLLKPSLSYQRRRRGDEGSDNYARPYEEADIWNFLTSVGTQLKENRVQRMVTLSEIADDLQNEGAFKDQDDDAERLRPNQLVFCAIGWLSKTNESYVADDLNP